MSISKYIFISKLVNSIIIIHLFFEFIGAYVLQYYFSEYSPILYEKLSYFIKSLNAVGEFSDYSLSRLIQFSLMAIYILCAPIIILYEYLANYKSYFAFSAKLEIRKISAIYYILLTLLVYCIQFHIFFFSGESLSENILTRQKEYISFGDCFICNIMQNILFMTGFTSSFLMYFLIGFLFVKKTKIENE